MEVIKLNVIDNNNNCTLHETFKSRNIRRELIYDKNMQRHMFRNSRTTTSGIYK